jgi:hypothetical protein
LRTRLPTIRLCILASLFLTSLFLTSLSSAQEIWIQYRPEARDLLGNPIDTIGFNEDFWLYMLVTDRREDPSGVFAAFVDVTYDDEWVASVGQIDHLKTFDVFKRGSAAAGFFDEVGGLDDGLVPTGGGEFELFRVLMHSKMVAGDLTFATDPAEDQILHASLLYDYDELVPSARVEFLTTGVTVVPEPASFWVLVWGLSLSTRKACHALRGRKRGAKRSLSDSHLA